MKSVSPNSLPAEKCDQRVDYLTVRHHVWCPEIAVLVVCQIPFIHKAVRHLPPSLTQGNTVTNNSTWHLKTSHNYLDTCLFRTLQRRSVQRSRGQDQILERIFWEVKSQIVERIFWEIKSLCTFFKLAGVDVHPYDPGSSSNFTRLNNLLPGEF